MRILFVDQSGKLGGAELCLAHLAAHFREQCVVVLFEDGPFAQRLRQDGITVEILQRGQRNNKFTKGGGVLQAIRALPFFFILAWKLIRRSRNFDLIYANTAKALLVTLPSRIVNGLPLAFHLHDIISKTHFSFLSRKLLVLSANHFADSIVCNSHATLNAFSAAGGSSRKCRVIYNGFIVDNFLQPLHEARTDQLRKAFKESNLPIAAVVGRLAPWKGQHILLEALKEVPDLNVVVIGDALFTEEDRTYARWLRAFVKDNSLGERVNFLGFQDDVISLLHACDILVHTSIAPEPFGRVVVEGMLCGLPVVATGAGGVQEIIRHEVTGFLVMPGDTADLVDTLRKLVSDPALRTSIGTAAKTEARKCYDLPKILHETTDVLQTLAQGKPFTALEEQNAAGLGA